MFARLLSRASVGVHSFQGWTLQGFVSVHLPDWHVGEQPEYRHFAPCRARGGRANPMIKIIALENFQSHAETRLDLAPGVNLVCGPSDSGKTAILRALRWLATNRPSGEEFRSHWGGDTTAVEIALYDGAEVRRFRSKGVNAYTTVPVGDGDGHVFKAIGSDVPEPVVELLNLDPLSWQGQMDAPFLLSESPGEVARVLNEVADLDKIDTAVTNVNRMLRENRAKRDGFQAQIDGLKIRLFQYRAIDQQLKKAERLEELEEKATLLLQMQAKAVEMIRDERELKGQVAAIKDVGAAEEMLDLIMDKMGQLRERESDLRAVTALMANAKNLPADLSRKQMELKELEESWHESFDGKACPLCGRRG